jgi:two-component system cell cycle sensor histidine kinase/response regulator CckA
MTMRPLRKPLRVLLVEDREVDAELLLHELKRANFEVTFVRVETADAMRVMLQSKTWDIVLSDFSLPIFDALGALEVLKASGLDIPLIVVSGTIGEEAATDALRAGARDFIVKGRPARLAPAIERELREARIRATLRRTEEQLRHAQKMEAIGQLAGGVAHDFNNLLSVILLNAELLAEGIKAGEPALGDVDEIKSAGLRATELTKQLLAYGRQQVFELRVVDLNEVVADVGKMLHRLIGADVEFTTLPGGELGLVEVDPGQVEQVLVNLVLNARDAMPQGGKLTVETANVDLNEDYAAAHVDLKAGRYVLLAVSDTGTGMDCATLARIFEPFFTTKEQGRGTGLGLSTVFGVVKQSGAHISVESEPGNGTAFKVYFPRSVRDKPACNPEPPVVSTQRGGETILLVEDEEQVRRVALVVLRRAGYDVLEALDCRDALLISEKHPGVIHLLLTDVVMPQMSGREVAARVGQMRPTTRILLMSGYAKAAVLQHGVIDSTVAFLQKPIMPDTLLRKIREVLDGAEPPGAER